MGYAPTAAVAATVLIGIVAGFQLALAGGAAYGAAVLGGKAPTVDGRLTPAFRALAAAQALVLGLLAWVLLARAGVVASPLLAPATLGWLTWVVLGFLVLNTLANLTAPHPLERWGMGLTTLVLSALTLVIALSP